MVDVRQILVPELAWVDGAARRHAHVEIDARGRIGSVAISSDDAAREEALAAYRNAAIRRMPRRALLPGFVNVHSHAFQRGLRGLGESYPEGMGDFWSWREAMYALVLRLTPEELRRLTRQAFDEMLAAGFTTVGEFHYVHHREIDARDFLLDEIIIETAREVGIRLVLLQCFYKTGGVGRPLAGGQLRFSTPDVDVFLRQTERLAASLDAHTQTLGLAPHSLRAVPTEDLKRLHAVARERGWVCHIHVEEQRKEIEEFRAAAGAEPLAWMLDHLAIGRETTIVHATHSTREHLDRYFTLGGNIVVCPLTEGNLGDGLACIADVAGECRNVCVGSDSNIRIDACEELRWLEFVQRLRLERRGAYKTRNGDVAPRLMDCGTRNGAAALGVEAGAIETGLHADLVAIDLDHPSIGGAPDDAVVAALLLGGSGAAVREVAVGGRWLR